MRDVLRRYMPNTVEDLTALNALYRPGPIQGGMIDDFIARKHGHKMVEYDLPAYPTAYLKTHYPVEFMATMLTAETGSTDKAVKYINECREMGIPVEPPDINVSDANFTPHGSAIRFGVAAVKNVGRTAIDSILSARKALARPFGPIFEFCGNCTWRLLKSRVLESRASTGATVTFGI